ncbi:uncharacterized protein PFL1_03702 [Pseudozyma flocculosa PF-1]|uniref:Related to PET100 \|nr:uncharacterized protein PFL1_03702 [Pseudozyma flocculosa PF-1]EPQ28901.1 hypothetical protein PFL1_03702 [Pseudozyma flocculosa PF-1]SPO38612.1 related to PET100 \
MAGPNLELFKFGMYLFFPLAVMVHYGDPEWYHRHVLPLRDQFWPAEESLYKPPRNATDVKASLEEFRQKRLAKREARLERERIEGLQIENDKVAAEERMKAAANRLV